MQNMSFSELLFDFSDKLKLKGASEYKYLNQSGCLVIHGVDDAEEFRKLLVSL